MVTIKCNEREKEVFEGLFQYMESSNFDCNGLDLSCECCPATCSGNRIEIEYQVEDSNSEVNTDKLVYISGAITGVYNYLDLFKQAESELKKLGYQVINPAEILSHLPKTTPYEVYMNMSYEMLSTCNYIYMIDGWEESNGAKLELEYAREHGIAELKIEDVATLDKKEYNITLNEFGEDVKFNITPNLERYSSTKNKPIFFKMSRSLHGKTESVFAGIEIEHAKWLHDSLGEILDTIEKKNK